MTQLLADAPSLSPRMFTAAASAGNALSVRGSCLRVYVYVSRYDDQPVGVKKNPSARMFSPEREMVRRLPHILPLSACSCWMADIFRWMFRDAVQVSDSQTEDTDPAPEKPVRQPPRERSYVPPNSPPLVIGRVFL